MRMFILLPALVACTADDLILEPEEAPPEGPRPSGVDLEPPDEGIQLTIGPFELEPHTETYWCKIARLPNTEPLDIVALEHQGSDTLHHFNIFLLTTAPDEEVEGPCDQVWAQTNMALSSPLYASQDPVFSGEFPEGVAGLLPADQAVLMEYHAVNAFSDPVVTEARLNAYSAGDAAIDHYANGLFGSIGDIDLPPRSQQVLSQDCYVGVDMEVFVIGSHFHARGERFEVLALDEQGQPADLLYESTDWESPLLSIFEPIHIPAGQGFQFRCHYDNDTDAHVIYGDGADDEMCMFAALYYPDQGFQLCRPNL